MLRISKLTDYATVILARLAAQPERRFNRRAAGERDAPSGADGIEAAETAAAARPGQFHTAACTAAICWRGRRSRSMPRRSWTRLEGPMALTECASSDSHCCIGAAAWWGRAWQRVNLAIRRSLQEITLLELAGLSVSTGQPSALDRGIALALGSIASRNLKRESL